MAERTEVIIPLHRPNLREKLFFLLSGIIVSVPVTLFVNIFSSHLCLLLPVFYAPLCAIANLAPFIEEFAKAYPLFYRHGETEKSILTLGFLVGMGFGISEFFLYVFGLGAAIYIRLPAVLFHASSTTITAYGIAIKRPFLFFLTASALHFSYNFSVSSSAYRLIGGPAVLIITYSLSWHLYRKTSERMID